MRWSFKIATVIGIPIRVHITFLLLLVLIGLRSADKDSFIPAGLPGVMLVGLVFVCVLLHEFGHCLMARRFGLLVDSITLLPIGGVTAMRSLPRTAGAELSIALAGPLVSFALAALCGLIALQSHGPGSFAQTENVPWVVRLTFINLVLGIFNLFPAFPMDGGRILRSLLWTRLGFVRATKFAAKTGQVLAGGLFILAFLTTNYMLILIAPFIYMVAAAEGRAAQWRGALAQIHAADAMLTSMERIDARETIEQVGYRARQSGQDHFPVFRQEAFVGLLTRNDLLRALHEQKLESPAAEFMTRRIVFCSPHESLAAVFQTMNEQELSCVAVMENDLLLGLITLEQISRVGLLARSDRSDRPGSTG